MIRSRIGGLFPGCADAGSGAGAGAGVDTGIGIDLTAEDVAAINALAP